MEGVSWCWLPIAAKYLFYASGDSFGQSFPFRKWEENQQSQAEDWWGRYRPAYVTLFKIPSVEVFGGRIFLFLGHRCFPPLRISSVILVVKYPKTATSQLNRLPCVCILDSSILSSIISMFHGLQLT